MKPSITSPTAKTKRLCVAGAILMIALALLSLFVGKYPLSLEKLLAGNEMHRRVFTTLRLSRTLVGLVGGFALGVQFHPEAAVMTHRYGLADAAQFMPLDQAIAFFRAIVSQAQ